MNFLLLITKRGVDKMGIGLLLRQIFSIPLYVGGQRAKIVRLDINTSTGVILKDDFYPGWRPANKHELCLFAKKYHPAFWFPPIFGIEPKPQETIFGTLAPLYRIKGTLVEQASQNLVWGLPSGSLILFIKKTKLNRKEK